MPRALFATALLAALAVAGCASTPSQLLALPPASPPEQTGDLQPGATVLLREVSLPSYLDGYPVVISRSGSTLTVSRDAEWAERPSVGVSRVLRDALAQRMGPSRVLITGDGRVPDADLTVEFLALDPEGDALHLDARWSFSCLPGASRAGRTRLQAPLKGATPQAVAAASSDALARLADTLAAAMPCGGTHNQSKNNGPES